MKRIKEACICQTLHFMLKEDVGHDYAVKIVKGMRLRSTRLRLKEAGRSTRSSRKRSSLTALLSSRSRSSIILLLSAHISTDTTKYINNSVWRKRRSSFPPHAVFLGGILWNKPQINS